MWFSVIKIKLNNVYKAFCCNVIMETLFSVASTVELTNFESIAIQHLIDLPNTKTKTCGRLYLVGDQSFWSSQNK